MTSRRVWGAILASCGLVGIAVATLVPYAIDEARQQPTAWCLACGGLWLTDFISNVALFLPLGVGLALLGNGVFAAIVVTTGLSFLVELCQFIGLPPGRSSALADVVANGAGGAIGAAVVIGWTQFARPRPRASALLATGWAMYGAALMLATAFVLGPRDDDMKAPFSVTPSPLPHAPGYGWYEDIVDSAIIASVPVRRGFTGPVIMRASRNVDSLTASVYLRGRDPTYAFVPIVYVHVRNDTSPVLLVGEHHHDAELRATRRAWDYGLTFPSLLLVDAFAERTHNSPEPLILEASVTRSAMRLSGLSSTVHDSALLKLDPTLGWSLIQTVVTVDSPLAALAQGLWLCLLAFPVGWWSAQASRWKWLTGFFGGALLTAGGAMGPVLLGVSPMPFTHWVGLAGCLTIGAVCSSHLVRRNSRP